MKEGGVIRLGNNKACKFHGISTVTLKMFDGNEFFLRSVRYVPELKQDLLLISMFGDLGYYTRIGRGVEYFLWCINNG